jgi:hypothetical protein
MVTLLPAGNIHSIQFYKNGCNVFRLGCSEELVKQSKVRDPSKVAILHHEAQPPLNEHCAWGQQSVIAFLFIRGLHDFE